jgi:hypothetical protein
MSPLDGELGRLFVRIDDLILRNQPFQMDILRKKQIGAVADLEIYANELQDSLADFTAWMNLKRDFQPDMSDCQNSDS